MELEEGWILMIDNHYDELRSSFIASLGIPPSVAENSYTWNSSHVYMAMAQQARLDQIMSEAIGLSLAGPAVYQSVGDTGTGMNNVTINHCNPRDILGNLKPLKKKKGLFLVPPTRNWKRDGF
jgi:hypothetical protein